MSLDLEGKLSNITVGQVVDEEQTIIADVFSPEAL